MCIDRTALLLRPSLRFIATLPTLKLKEAEEKETVVVDYYWNKVKYKKV